MLLAHHPSFRRQTQKGVFRSSGTSNSRGVFFSGGVDLKGNAVRAHQVHSLTVDGFLEVGTHAGAGAFLDGALVLKGENVR